MNFSTTNSYHLILGALKTAALTLSVMPSAVSADKNIHRRLLRNQHDVHAKAKNNNVHIRQLSNTTDTPAAQYCTIGMEALLQLPNETQMMDDEIFTCTMDTSAVQSEEGDIFTEGNATSDSTTLCYMNSTWRKTKRRTSRTSVRRERSRVDKPSWTGQEEG